MEFKNIKQLEEEIEELEAKAKELEKTDIYSGDLVRVHSKLSKLNLILNQIKTIYEMIEERLKDYKQNLQTSKEGIELKDNNLEYYEELKLREEEVIQVLEEILSKMKGEEK